MQKSERGRSGFMSIDGEFEGFTLELPWLDNKKSISCIRSGKYEIRFREEPTPMTMKYRKKYDWFHWHLQLIGVKGRSGIYIHIANTVKDLLGCIGIGKQINTDLFLANSTKAYKAFYSKVSTALRKDEKVIITIE